MRFVSSSKTILLPFLLLFLLLFLAPVAATARSRSLAVDEPAAKESHSPLPRAHAHNDYLHERPLLDALAEGFTSVEADIYLAGGALLVGHDRKDLEKDRTLRKLYLEPLGKLVRKNHGRVYPGGGGFFLLVDIKADGAATWRALARELEPFRDMLSEFGEDGVKERAVTVVISGERAWDEIAATSPRLAGVDGRLADLEGDRPPSLMPLVSDNWRSHFRWDGNGEMPPAERKKLREIVRRAHEKSYRVRFWATPDRPEMWGELLSAEVDCINTDDLSGLGAFLRARGDGVKTSEKSEDEDTGEK